MQRACVIIGRRILGAGGHADRLIWFNLQFCTYRPMGHTCTRRGQRIHWQYKKNYLRSPACLCRNVARVLRSILLFYIIERLQLKWLINSMINHNNVSHLNSNFSHVFNWMNDCLVAFDCICRRRSTLSARSAHRFRNKKIRRYFIIGRDAKWTISYVNNCVCTRN